MQDTWVWSLGLEDPLEKRKATHSSILAWRIPWTEEPGGLQSMGSQRVGHNWATNMHTHLNRLWGSWEQGPILNSSFYVWNCTKKYQHVWPTDVKILDHSRKILRFLPCNTGWVLVTFPEMERTGSKSCLGLGR